MMLEFSFNNWHVALEWYWILIALILVISTSAAIYHGKFSPALWGWVLSIGLYYGFDYLNPVLFG